MLKHSLGRAIAPLLTVSFLAAMPALAQPPSVTAPMGPSIQFKVQQANQRMEMTVNTSRILTLDRPILRAQVNNPSVVVPNPLSPNEIQMSAKGVGVTQVNLWDENDKLFTVDVIVYADTAELTMNLKALFPSASLKVIPIGERLLISGQVDQPEHADKIMEIAEAYSDRAINNLTLSGVQQVALQVKVIEVSRTKLRKAGFDWQQISGVNNLAVGLGKFVNTATIGFSVTDGANSLTAVMDLLREDKLAKLLSEPTLITSSGRPAMFQVGGEIGYIISGTTSDAKAAFKTYGTQIDFLPVVLGNGRINLQVRAMISENDPANSVLGVPALKTRQAETGVELKAGQTLAIAGLLQTRIESTNAGLPWISEVPLLGIPFRRVKHERNEVELLILVTPQLIDPMDPHEVPKCLPGMQTTDPNDWELIVEGHLEVPNCCGDGSCGSCNQCRDAQSAQGQSVQGRPAPQPPIAPQGAVIIEQNERVIRPPTDASAGRLRQPISTSQAIVGPTRSTWQRPNPLMAHSRQDPSGPQITQTSSQDLGKVAKPSFHGPIGYDVVK